MNALFRIEVGNEGQWYIAMNDGQTSADADFQGGWTYGEWVHVLFTYDNGSAELYEDGELVHAFDAPANLAGAEGTLVLDSHKGTERFLRGAVQKLRITEW